MLLAFVATCCIWQQGRAQSFMQTTPFDTIVMNNDTLHWYFLSPAANAYGNATLTVYYEGDFGDASEEIVVYGENWSLIGNTGNSASNNDCNPGLDSAFFTIPASLINAWEATGDTIKIYGITSPNVDVICTTNHGKARLSYNYCSSPNAQTANFPMSVTQFCASDAAVTLTATPAGGTFSGSGVSGNTFDPEMLPAGTSSITYTVTDTTGCTSSASVSVTVLPSPAVNGIPPYVCSGSNVMLTATGSDYFVWYADAAMTTALDTTTTGAFTTPALTQGATYYVAAYDSGYVFQITSLTDADSMAIDHDAFSGDDRGGIAVTNNYIYVVGDNNTARFDLDLTPASGMSYPRRDGIFSNLADGKLYSLYNGSLDPQSPSLYNFSQIIEMNDDLTFTTNVINLSQTIVMGSNNEYSGIFAGYNLLIVYSGETLHWYAIDLTNGDVEDLGLLSSPEFYGSENWAIWGIAEYDGTDYSVLFRHNNGDEIHRRVLPAQASTLVGQFSYLSDMASITYAPWNNRWYFHHEGSSQFGSFSEAVGYAGASNSTVGLTVTPAFACPTEVELTIGPEVHIAPLASTTYCTTEPGFLVSATPAGGVFTGTGINNGVFDPSFAGEGTHTIVYTYTDANSCSVSDTVTIVVNACTSINELTAATVSVQPNPNNGLFTLSMNAAAATEVNVEVLSIDGRVVYTERMSVNPGSFTTNLDITHLANGIYYLRVATGNSQGMVKLVKN